MSKSKIDIYTQHDIDVINDNIDVLMNEADIIKQTKYEPTIDEFRNIIKEIEKYVKSKNRIIYGGTALNRLIASKNPKDAFYKEYDRPDFEFYSYEPIQDVKGVCDMLHNKGYKYVSSAEAQHGNTYKIFVNEMEMGDITYVPTYLYHKLPTIELDGLKYIHPHFAYIDYLRMYTDPIMSFWRLQKAIPRGILLLKHFPLEVGSEKIKYDILSDKEVNVLKDISKYLNDSDTTIHVGTYAVKFFTIDKTNDLLPYEVISVEYEKDVKKIYDILNKKYKITVKEYWPFFQFWDRHTEFIFNDKVVLTVFRNMDKCVPYRKYDAGFIASYQVVLLHHIIKYYYYIINKNDPKNINNTIGEILRTRNDYLKKHNKNVMDDTIFREFQISCLGKSLDPMRYAFIKMQKKLAEGKAIKWRYNPRTDQEDKLPEFSFDNESGNEIKNSKYMTIKSDSSESDSESSQNRTTYTLEDSEIDSSQEDTLHASFVKPMESKGNSFAGISDSSETKYTENTMYTSEFI